MKILEEKFYKTDILKTYYKHFDFLSKHSNYYDIEEALPLHVKNSYIEDKNSLIEKVSVLDSKDKYICKAKLHELFLNSLKPSKINVIAYKAFLEVEKNASIKHTLETFKPSKSYTKNISYSTTNNVTGRLVVESGPNILTLPKKNRSIITSRFEGGKILSVDFSSLEPRLCLKLVGKDADIDLYEHLNSSLELNLDRKVIKRAIISVLYGAHYTSLKEISQTKSKVLFEFIKDFFGLDKVLEISKNKDEHGIRRNFEGRPLWNLEETKENILINNYLQSSAVDIALDYFASIVSELDNIKAVPLFVLHDAMIFDIEQSYLEEFEKVILKGYTHKKLGKFPLKSEIFNLKNEEM